MNGSILLIFPQFYNKDAFLLIQWEILFLFKHFFKFPSLVLWSRCTCVAPPGSQCWTLTIMITDHSLSTAQLRCTGDWTQLDTDTMDTPPHSHCCWSVSCSLTPPPPTHSCSSCSSQLLQLSDINHSTTAFTLLLMTAGEVCHERCYQRLWGVSSETAARRQVLLLRLLSLGKNSEVIEWVEQPGGSAQSAVLNLSSAQQQHDHLDQGEAKIVSKNAFHPQVYEC